MQFKSAAVPSMRPLANEEIDAVAGAATYAQAENLAIEMASAFNNQNYLGGSWSYVPPDGVDGGYSNTDWVAGWDDNTHHTFILETGS